jgi:hypothetical protein
MHIVTIFTCYERTNTKENLQLWEETNTTQNPAEEQHAYCNMLRENKCLRES